jgi:hypothetical protein
MKPILEKSSNSPEIADLATVLAAAKAAPAVFNITTYFLPLCIMRQKGYSWRQLGDWVAKFNITISPVHLRRLYVQENDRLASLTRKELVEKGCDSDTIDEILQSKDPTRKLTAIDPEDAALSKARRKLLQDEAGLSDEEIGNADLTSPVTVGGKKL